MTNRRMITVSAVLLVALAGSAFGGALYDAFFNSAAGLDLACEQAYGTDDYPTMSAEIGPLIGGQHLCNFYVQGHSGEADLSDAKLVITCPGVAPLVYTATYANGGLVTNSEGTLAAFVGISVPSNFEFAQVQFTYSDEVCYDMSLTPDDL